MGTAAGAAATYWRILARSRAGDKQPDVAAKAKS
jgi:hypothetical protein